MTLMQTRILAAQAVGALARRSGRRGTSLPGKLLVALDSRAISRLAARLPRGSVVISATNGKTSTAAMVASILEKDGARLVHNRAGANMAGGVASALLAAAHGRDGIDGDRAAVESAHELDRVLCVARARVEDDVAGADAEPVLRPCPYIPRARTHRGVLRVARGR